MRFFSPANGPVEPDPIIDARVRWHLAMIERDLGQFAEDSSRHLEETMSTGIQGALQTLASMEVGDAQKISSLLCLCELMAINLERQGHSVDFHRAFAKAARHEPLQASRLLFNEISGVVSEQDYLTSRRVDMQRVDFVLPYAAAGIAPEKFTAALPPDADIKGVADFAKQQGFVNFSRILMSAHP